MKWIALLLIFSYATILPATAEESDTYLDAKKCIEAYNIKNAKAYEICLEIAEEPFGNKFAQKVIGDMYFLGFENTVKVNYKQAIRWYKRAAVKDHSEAKYNIAVMYEQGLGILSADYVIAAKWYYSAANRGYINAQFNLANMYAKGSGVRQNQEKAVMWYERAANQGDADAQYNLANRYLVGHGVKKNLLQAYKWYTLAAAQNNIKASKSLENMITYLTPEQISKGNLALENWSAKLEAVE